MKDVYTRFEEFVLETYVPPNAERYIALHFMQGSGLINVDLKQADTIELCDMVLDIMIEQGTIPKIDDNTIEHVLKHLCTIPKIPVFREAHINELKEVSKSVILFPDGFFVDIPEYESKPALKQARTWRVFGGIDDDTDQRTKKLIAGEHDD